jgi:AraC-like DNA-binding protein
MGLDITAISLGKVIFKSPLNMEEQVKLVNFLADHGFETMSDRHTRLVQKVKQLVVKYVSAQSLSNQKVKFSRILSDTLNMNYDSVSEIFAASESITIEKYLIARRIEKVIELLVYTNKTLTEISHTMNYSSIQHLSKQFRQITGFTPSHYRKLKKEKVEISKQAS